MNTPAKTFGSPSGEPSTTRPMPQQMCEKLWTLPLASGAHATLNKIDGDGTSISEPVLYVNGVSVRRTFL
jgi:hypothetical protein